MIHLTLCTLALLPLATLQDPWQEPLDRALSLGGLSQASARFDESLLRFYRRGEFATPAYSAMSESPWRIPWMMGLKRRELAGFSGQGHLSLSAFGPWMNWSVRRTLISNPIADLEAEAAKPESLATILKRLGGAPTSPLKTLPAAVRQATALLLLVSERAEQYRLAAFAQAGDLRELYADFSAKDPFDTPAHIESRLAKLRRVNVNTLAAGAHDLFLASAKARDLIAAVPPTENYSCSFITKLGMVHLSGGKESDIAGDPLILMNTGDRDDTYRLAHETPLSRPATVVIDCGGNDTYLSAQELEKTPVAQFSTRKSADNQPGPAGALLSTSVLIDVKGNDLYRSHKPGLGSGRLGFAWLLDMGGNDAYDGYADSQGFGMFGGGILEDLSGNDRYEGFNQVQGCGQTAGFGLLVDRSGDDVYVGNNTVIDFGSAQDNKNNTLMGQGAGNGRRADYLEGNSLAGGVGVLFDQAGADRYSAAMFCQGVGYWEGVGALWDSAGEDSYIGAWYAMGASAHFAIGYLEDEQGNDQYDAGMNMAIGAGHDFSVGVLVDRSGDDAYKGPNLSLGAGNANGIGWLLEMAGDDRYLSSGVTLGKAAEDAGGSMRERALCFGLFMDLAGKDAYPPDFAWAGNGRESLNKTAKPHQFGVFLDR